MTPDEINRAIAESVGYRVVSSLEWGLFWLETPEGKPNGYRQGISEDHAWVVCCPNYHSSRDACAEFESAITDHASQDEYVSLLVADLYQNHDGIPTCQDEAWICCVSTAPQRCEAYLRTMNLWRDQ